MYIGAECLDGCTGGVWDCRSKTGGGDCQIAVSEYLHTLITGVMVCLGGMNLDRNKTDISDDFYGTMVPYSTQNERYVTLYTGMQKCRGTESQVFCEIVHRKFNYLHGCILMVQSSPHGQKRS